MSIDNPLILSIETSGATCGAAISEGSEIVAEYSVFGKNLHDKLNAELIRRLLNDNGLAVGDLDAVAVSSGPGSFTGLRIGGSIAKGLCFENEPKLISVPTLSAYAFAAADFARSVEAGEIIAIISSHKDLLYCQRFNIDAEEKSPAEMITIQEFLEIEAGRHILCGAGASVRKDGFTLPYLRIPRASFISALAYKFFKEGKFSKAEDYEPVYVQEFTPKTKRKMIL
jgi:tRNA threonylcarbamoyladenosine biosynthesis protein TsaB